MRIYATFLILCLCLLVRTGTAQVFRGHEVNYRDQKLSDMFRSYQVYTFPIADLHTYVHQEHRAQPGTPVQFLMGHRTFEWTLYEHTILSPDAKGITLRDGQYVELPFDRQCRTFIGYRDDVAEEARMTITAENFMALIPDGKSKIFIQPLYHFNKSADRNLVVLYTEGDLKPIQNASCGASPKLQTNPTLQSQPNSKHTSSQSRARTFSCRELQVSFATDNQMWQEYEDVELLLDFNLTALNIMEPFFDDFDLDFWVEEFFMVTDPANAANPWGTATDVDDLISDFGDWAGDYFSSQDIGHLWTNHDLHDGENYNAIGYASVGGACGDIGIYQWAILERFSANFYPLALLQAHEYGHLLDADHEPNTGTIMEPSLDLVESATWAQANIDEMLSFMEDESCIQTCVHCLLSYQIMDYISWGDWKYSAVLNINSTAVIDSVADVIFQSEGFVKLTPGFSASSVQPSSAGGTFVARIAGCE
jgi:hypothetical protein